MPHAKNRFPVVNLALPEGLEAQLPPPDHRYSTVETRMDLALRLAHWSITEAGGGPFAAAVFDLESQFGSLVCGARDRDVRAIGFDEGTKPRNWVRALRARGIEVLRDIGRNNAIDVLSAYRVAGGPIYNGGTHSR